MKPVYLLLMLLLAEALACRLIVESPEKAAVARESMDQVEMSEGSHGLDAWGVESRQHSSRSTGFEALPESLSPTLPTCCGGDWHKGWVVFVA